MVIKWYMYIKQWCPMFKKGIAELDQNTLSEEAELAAKAEEVCCADEACP